MSIPTLNIPIQSESAKPFIKQGDTIPKIGINIPELDLTGATIKMQIYNGKIKVLDLSNNNGITLIDANNFEIDEIPAADNNLPKGTLIGDLEITDSSGRVKTYLNIEYTIIKQYTL